MNYIDSFLNSTTMYKVVMYTLVALLLEAFILSFVGILPYSPISLFALLATIGITSLSTQYLFKYIYKAPAEKESTYISILIAFFILAPLVTKEDYIWTITASFVMIASKYIVAHKYRHIFNPVAFGVFVVGVMGAPQVTWWVSSIYFAPLVLVSLFLIVHKLKHYRLLFGYLLGMIAVTSIVAGIEGYGVLSTLTTHFLSWPVLFLAAFMLTEPFTTPPTKNLQGVYGLLIGALSSITFALPPLYSTPEFALLVGNCFSFLVSTKSRVFLMLTEKKEIAKDTFELVFTPSEKIKYVAGQYMEWTLPHTSPDTRGIRRYFTIASSPDGDSISLGVKRAAQGSSFKQNLFELPVGKGLLATAVMGDFTLPANSSVKSVWIAGGIGITPFMSMLRTLLLRKEKRDIILFYANKTEDEIAYKDILDNASQVLGVQTVHFLSDKEKIASTWAGEQGFITEGMLKKYIHDVAERNYYISGPPQMVSSYAALLSSVGVPSSRITTDFFPGFN